MPVLDARDLWQEYPTRSGPLTILRGIDLQLEPGQAVAILGPSGSGKSTLLHVLGTLARPTRGVLLIGGEDPFRLSEPELARFRNTRIGFIFQEHHLLPQCTALENVLLPALAANPPFPPLVRGGGKAPRGGESGSGMVARASGLLEKVGLGRRLQHHPAELSGGERQRVAVCRALVQKPALVLADEPTGSLDRSSAGAVGDLLLSLCKDEQASLVCVTHSAELAARFPLRMELIDGKIEAAT
jgi:lipoprotein-releasing system ATP-binding protein